MWNKIWRIILNAIPVALMVGLIPIVLNDYVLALIYILIAITSFVIKREEHDYLAYAFGLLVITAAEYFFIQTGVETFVRNSLFGIMPIWLPFLWAYAFTSIKRSLRILDQ
ncbi:MAG: hypothetical protein WCS97_01310 [Candidatus Paceibacterota bacterium]